MLTTQTPSSDSLVEPGSLKVGVFYNGELHIDFVLRPANVEDNLFAIMECGLIPDGERKPGEVRPGDLVHNMRTGLAMVSRQVLSLGTIPAHVINYKFLLENLDPADLDVLYEANDRLKKKRAELPIAGATSLPAPQ